MVFVWADLLVFGEIRYTTILTAVIVAIIVSWRTGRLLLGPLTAVAWASTYEIVYAWTGTFVHGWNILQTAWVSAALVGWVLLGYVRRVRIDPRTIVLFVALWFAWIAAGFYSNNATSAFDPMSEVLNVSTKTWLAVCFVMGTSRCVSLDSSGGSSRAAERLQFRS
jgi:hypothetical protein